MTEPTSSALLQQGYTFDFFEPPPALVAAVVTQRWDEVDTQVARLVQPGGELFGRISRYIPIISTEFIISIRDSRDPDQEDGIWHDDGSRRLAFTWSLTTEPIEGGVLGIRAVGQLAAPVMIPTPALGGLIVYLTGQFGFEHKIHQVTRGKRVVIACWGS